jgi:hypothetical protein
LRRSPEVRSLNFFHGVLQVSAGKDCNVSVLGSPRQRGANAETTSARGVDFPLLPIPIGFLRRLSAEPCGASRSPRVIVHSRNLVAQLFVSTA